jgi:ketosteroid isomerase-like protein
MNKSNVTLLAAAVAAMLAPISAGAGPADEAGIRELEARFAAAVNARDLDAIMKVCSPDVFVFDVVPPRQYVGAAAYRDDWKNFLAGFSGPVRFEISDLAVSSQGPLGYGHSIQHVAGKDPQGTPVDVTVRVTDVYRKGGGIWQIVLEHVSVPVDLATAKADLTSKP